jgi:hypothetical protein
LKQLDLFIDSEIRPSKTEIGKRYMFWNKGYPDTEKFGFSSTLENIGNVEKHDRWLKNKTEVIIISDQMIANHMTMGAISVIHVMAHQTMWIATASLWPMDIE